MKLTVASVVIVCLLCYVAVDISVWWPLLLGFWTARYQTSVAPLWKYPVSWRGYSNSFCTINWNKLYKHFINFKFNRVSYLTFLAVRFFSIWPCSANKLCHNFCLNCDRHKFVCKYIVTVKMSSCHGNASIKLVSFSPHKNQES